MTARVWPVDAVTGAPSYTGRSLRQAQVAPALAGATSARPLGGLSGVRPGTVNTIATATSTTWTVTPFAGSIDGEALAIAGPYLYAFDANVTGSVTAAAGSARIDRLDVQVSDPAESDGSSVPAIAVVYNAGVPGSGVPVAAPARSHPLALINVPLSGGGSPTVTWNATYTAATGGVLEVNNSTFYPAAATYPGLRIHDIALDLDFRSNGTSWIAPTPYARFKGTITTSKAVATNAKWGISTGPTFDSTDDPLSGFSSATGLYTCKVAGTYMVVVQAKANTSGFPAAGGLVVQKNGSNALLSGNNPSAGGFTGLNLVGYLRLAVNDTVSCQFGNAFTTQSDSPADNNFFELIQVQS